MRNKRLIKLLSVLFAGALLLVMTSPTWAESGCHKIKGKSGQSRVVQSTF